MRSIEFMKKYIADWDANVARSKTAAEMRANVLKQYPGLGMEFTLNDRIATYFPAQPAAGKVSQTCAYYAHVVAPIPRFVGLWRNFAVRPPAS